ncbi:serine/threonine protein kinase [Streptomyces sp. NBC_00264]|uniref:serine/threonine-protein kinase n=1 Tax=unclassified Streptomyces TaxID=2593676 RepID=UPI0022512CBD|nr:MULTISPECIES: serine/threonine-protein kinase [unclassified Streptomyces]WSX01984.1 serine/threonine protein kinase [Streptomyces sp. NBC_00987]MCX5101247.1 serine/threonine protein kinase [Streptomyces sp. NBC_00439]MCX5160769.1 serine/threonine protein kinase [Streptomyces sp. NBC_00305]MCX5219292.1 serine/threonine protein kinase [Streptomyces sp. NBC_00264]WSP48570.1 serine/threonine protein kinase [Streptomyces sp. NBC_01243]
MRDQLLGNRYRLVRQIGEGGMGEVWEARDETLHRPVAVKVVSLLAGGGSRGGEARARFLREARLTARLQHPGIVTVHDLGESGPEDGNAPFLVMELVQGETLDVKLREGSVPLAEAARWGAAICDALGDAHADGILHRDIKPSNIMITAAGAVKVLDFGVARAADPGATSDHLTRTGFIVGTPPYMAPEQARGRPEPASDLYALGCLLFELVTGRRPFLAPDTVGYLTAHLIEEPPAPSSVATGIPGAWDDLLLRLLRKDPAERYGTAAEASRALRQLDCAPDPGPDPAPPTPRPTPEPTPPASPPPPTRPLPTPTGTPATVKAAIASSVWLLIVLAATYVTVININNISDGRDIATGAVAIALATVVLVGYLKFPVAGRRLGRGPAELVRFLVPTALFAVYGMLTASHIADYSIEEVIDFSGLAVLFLTSLLVFSAVLTPRTGGVIRKVGYALVGLNAVVVLNSLVELPGLHGINPGLYAIPPQPVTGSVTLLSIALYGVRASVTRSAARRADLAQSQE